MALIPSLSILPAVDDRQLSACVERQEAEHCTGVNGTSSKKIYFRLHVLNIIGALHRSSIRGNCRNAAVEHGGPNPSVDTKGSF